MRLSRSQLVIALGGFSALAATALLSRAQWELPDKYVLAVAGFLAGGMIGAAIRYARIVLSASG